MLSESEACKRLSCKPLMLRVLVLKGVLRELKGPKGEKFYEETDVAKYQRDEVVFKRH